MSNPSPNVGVILSGCGVFDGSEIHEAVITLLTLDQLGARYQCMAPDKSLSVVDHVTKKPTGEKRNVLVESARIARGNVIDLAKVNAGDYDAFALPGGFGAAKNLCTFATDGPSCTVDPQVRRVLVDAHRLGKPIAFICIAPAVAAAVFGKDLHPTLTIGNDAGTASALTKMGAQHQNCDIGNYVLDAGHGLISTPAYMYPRRIAEVHAGVSKTIAQLLKMIP